MENKTKEIFQLLRGGMTFLGSPSELNDSLFRLHYLFILKYQLNSEVLRRMELLLTHIIPTTLSNNIQELYYEVGCLQQIQINQQQIINQDQKDLQQFYNQQLIRENEIFISFLPSERIQLDRTTIENVGMQNKELRLEMWAKQVSMTQLAATKIFQQNPEYKVIIIAVKVDNQDLANVIINSAISMIEQPKIFGQTTDYLITYHFLKGSENAFNCNYLKQAQVYKGNNQNQFISMYQMHEIGAHPKEDSSVNAQYLPTAFTSNINSISQPKVKKHKLNKYNSPLFTISYQPELLQFLQINYHSAIEYKYDIQNKTTVMGGGIAFSCLLCEQLYIKIFCHFQCG
ncbi:Hypothetical_protein [Hexamita inflata]|uniref:Hypothetical_protein n=1 Tax=Hexamita inflata TaxID=28002 RepID=A0AA86NLZ3_9EUKA|nr:Hypothetical protein HINF_LOCUS9337 [Hexamita inflata]